VRKPTNRFGTAGFDQSRTAAFASISAGIAEIAPDSRPARIAGPKLRAEGQQVVTGSSHQSLIGQRSNVGVAHHAVTKKQS
jgi:hypothetical protein